MAETREMILVDRPSALVDAPVEIVLRGFPPRQPVTVTAIQSFPNAARWRAQASFTSDDGRVEVARQAPVAGSYDGVSAMGLIWSAERLAGAGRPPPADAVMRPRQVHLEATAPGGLRAEATLERRVAGPGVTRQEVRHEGVVGTLFLPPGAGPHPCVIALDGGGGGVNEYWGAILASHGYAALALATFNAPGRPRGLVDLPLEYFETAIAWMRRQAWLRDHFLAVWGPSRGGELALLLGASFPEIDAVVAWSPSGVIFWALGLAEDGDGRPRAAWTFRGKPLPYLQEDNPYAATAPAREADGTLAWTPAYLRHLEDARAVARATIPVEKIGGPVLLVSGGADRMWPSSRLAEIARRRLEAQDHPFAVRHLTYEGAGHRILVPYGPVTPRTARLPVQGLDHLRLSQGGTPKADADAGVDAWRQTLAFLEAGVRGGG